MNTSVRQRYTVITVNYSGYCDLIKDKTIKVLNTIKTLLNHSIDTKWQSGLLYTCQIEHITEDQAIPQPEVKPDNFKPLQARVIGVNDPLDRLRENKAKFEVGSLYDSGRGYKVEIVKRTAKTVTWKIKGLDLTETKKIHEIDISSESFYTSKDNSRSCYAKNKIIE